MDQKTLEKVEELYNIYGSLRKVARELNIPKTTLTRNYNKWKDETPTVLRGADDTEYKRIIPEEVYKPAYFSINKETVKIVAIGDVHDSPDLKDKSRFKWLARFASERKPDAIVQIGDIADIDSCSTHQNPGTVEYALRPTIAQDMESLEEALDLFNSNLSQEIPLLFTKGNHEDRLDRFENSNPEVEGIIVSSFDDLMKKYKWNIYKYAQWVYVNDVAFVHTPMNLMGAPYGGKYPENMIGADSVSSLVWGHTHKGVLKSYPKLGPQQGIDVLNLGCAMPSNHIKRYASKATTGWTYGVWELYLRHGRIVSFQFMDMDILEQTYKD